jgi:hypothetical protein
LTTRQPDFAMLPTALPIDHLAVEADFRYDGCDAEQRSEAEA